MKDVVSLITDYADRNGFGLEAIECDRDHIHFLIEMPPRISPSTMVKNIKQETTYTLWSKYEMSLKKEFRKTRLFWSPSYFISSVGVSNEATIREYIENQGRNTKPIHPRT